LDIVVISCDRIFCNALPKHTIKSSIDYLTSAIQIDRYVLWIVLCMIYSGHPIKTTKRILVRMEEPVENELIQPSPLWRSWLSALGALFNMLNTTVGASLLSMPFAYRTTGIITSTLLLFFISILIIYTYYLLIQIAEKTGSMTFQEISEKSFGPTFGYISETCVFLFCFGCIVAYVVIISDLSTSLFRQLLGPQSIFVNKYFITALVMIVLIFPMCILRHIDLISYASGISIFAAAAIIVIVTIKCVQYRINVPIDFSKILLFGRNPTWILASTSLFSFALGAHQSCLPVYTELKNASPQKMTILCSINVFICFCTYSGFGLVGYLLFGEATLDNILKNLDNDWIGYTSKAGVSIIIIMTYPVILTLISFSS
jgi:amino acid permease